jgi:hypothetical protein
LSVYEEAVLGLLKSGPKRSKEIIKQLCPRIMSRRKVQNVLNELESGGKVKVVSQRIEGTRRFTTWFALPSQQYLLSVDAGRVVAAIERLREVLLRPPTVEEIAIETGITPSSAEKWAYELAEQTGWFYPRPGLIKDAAERLGEVLVCAARIRDDVISDFDYESDPEIVREAEHFLKKHPELSPKLSEDGVDVVSWPSETLKNLGKWYKPKERIQPTFLVIPKKPTRNVHVHERVTDARAPQKPQRFTLNVISVKFQKTTIIEQARDPKDSAQFRYDRSGIREEFTWLHLDVVVNVR